MDSRVERHADVVVEHCIEAGAGDAVQVAVPAEAEDLAVALYEKLGAVGALPTLTLSSSRAMRAYDRAMDPADFETPAHSLAAMEETDALVAVKGDANTAESSDVPPEALQARTRAHQPISEARPDRWVLTQYPSSGNAQKAEMSTEAYAEFVWNAVDKDWAAQRDHQEKLVELLDPAEEAHIVSGETTDLTMSVAGMDAVNDYGERNLPGGEVFTAPVPDSVEGEVLFDKPVMYAGREIRDAYLRFEGGEVVEHAAGQNEAALTSVLETDEGARRLGELGIGMNRDIDRFTDNMLFDEKMGDTVHLAVGRTIDECVPESDAGNDSAVHLDMIVDMSEDSRIELDGDVIQRDGRFVFEDGFDG